MKRVAWLLCGIVVAVGAVLPPMDALADTLFSAHMAQHVLLAVVAPPLLVAGSPDVLLIRALPPNARQGLVRGVRRHAWIGAAWRALTRPLVACGLHAVALWGWHTRALYVAALEHDAVHALEHASFLGTGALLWWSILRNHSGSRRMAYGVGLITLFITAMQSGALGALITLSRQPWFPEQSAGAAAHGLSLLDDQQLAGLIMWVVAGLLYVVAMSAVFLAWMKQLGRRSAALATAAAVGAVTLAGCSRAEASVIPGGDATRGRTSFAALHCGSCHTLSGVREAQGEVGPPLDGIARRSLIAGELPNTPENMARWIMDPQAIDSGTAMPDLHVTAPMARDMVAYLYTLK